MPQSFTKDTNAILPYQIDWSSWLPEGDTIATSVWTVDSGITITDEEATTTTTTVWISGGQAGRRYKATNRITTVGGLGDDRSIYFTIVER